MTAAESRFLVLDIGCAECRGASFPEETIVKVLGRVDTVEEAQALADPCMASHSWCGKWVQDEAGWFMEAGDGELRILDLEAAS